MSSVMNNERMSFDKNPFVIDGKVEYCNLFEIGRKAEIVHIFNSIVNSDYPDDNEFIIVCSRTEEDEGAYSHAFFVQSKNLEAANGDFLVDTIINGNKRLSKEDAVKEWLAHINENRN